MVTIKRHSGTVLLAVLLMALIVSLMQPLISAASLTSRKITVGTPVADAVTSHTFNFTIETGLTVGSFEMEYCTNSPFVGESCAAPAGFTLVSASLGTQTGVSGFSIHPDTTANRLVLGRIPSGVAPGTDVTLRINSVTNPSTEVQTVFVRISTFATSDATGVRGDAGPVAFSTSKGLGVSGFVPPYITACVGVTVASDCSTSTGSFLSFGELSTSQPRSLTTQFAAATNDPGGYTVRVQGTTLTSGNNVIPAPGSPTLSQPGSSQFGINVRANTTPTVGSNVTGSGSGAVEPDYNSLNRFLFDDDTIARATEATDFNRYTVSYIANISGAQPPGIYTATMTYVATAAF